MKDAIEQDVDAILEAVPPLFVGQGLLCDYDSLYFYGHHRCGYVRF